MCVWVVIESDNLGGNETYYTQVGAKTTTHKPPEIYGTNKSAYAINPLRRIRSAL